MNICGASLIALVSEKMGTMDFPFIFGGDGATLLLPNNMVETLKADFSHLIYKIKNDFRLELRIGVVPYIRIKNEGHLIQMGKLKRSSANSFAHLSGDGIESVASTEKIEFTNLINTLGHFLKDKKYRPIAASDIGMDSFYRRGERRLHICSSKDQKLHVQLLDYSSE